MQGAGTLKRIFDFYRQGFSNMDIGKTLWMVIIVKLVVIFAKLKAISKFHLIRFMATII